jgi:hypothetical protein
MAKKTEKTESKKAAAKAKAKKPEQLKVPGTERKGTIPEIAEAATRYREARDARMELAEEEAELQQDLTNLLKKHGITEYVGEDEDGKPYKAFIAEAKAKVQRVKEPKAPKVDE